MSHRSFIRGMMAILVAGGTAGIYALWRQGVPLWGAHLLSIGLVTFLCYGIDKQQAKANRTRLPEAVLHVLALIGGTPGAFLGQVVFRHKTVKRSFRLGFWFIVLLQCAALGFWLYSKS